MNSDIEIFLLIGQSNMAGRGDLNDVTPIRHAQILMYRKSEWIVAEEPLHTDNSELAGTGLAMSFANELRIVQPKIKIGLVPCAVGWTSLDQWMPGEDCYENTISITKNALKYGNLYGILWHQGESDSVNKNDASNYGKRLKKIIYKLRLELNCIGTPFIAGQLGSFLKNINEFKYYNLVNKCMLELETEIKNFYTVSSDGLNDKGDYLHFDSKSLRKFGIRFARRYLSITNI